MIRQVAFSASFADFFWSLHVASQLFTIGLRIVAEKTIL